MNHIDELKDYLIADEILRIETLSRNELIKELVAVKTAEMESSPISIEQNRYETKSVD